MEHCFKTLKNSLILNDIIKNNPDVDLFEHYQYLPKEVNLIIEEMGNDMQEYKDLEAWRKRMNAEGFDFDFDLSGTAYDLKRL